MSQLNADLKQNYALFIQQVRDSGHLFGLQHEDDWVVCDSTELADTDVLPLWSDEADARQHCVDEWADYQPAAISLDEFFDDWVNDLHQDGVLIGVNWNTDLDGLEVEPMDLAQALSDEA